MSNVKSRRAKPSASSQSSIPHPEIVPGAPSPSEPAGPTPMELAYAEWQQARAVLGQADVEASASPQQFNEDDGLITEALKRADASEWKIIQTRVKNGFDVRLRAMALQQVYLDAEMAGEPTDHRHQMMLLALIHDVLDPRFDWGEHH